MLHVWYIVQYIFLQNWVILFGKMFANVGKYSSTMVRIWGILIFSPYKPDSLSSYQPCYRQWASPAKGIPDLTYPVCSDHRTFYNRTTGACQQC